MRRLITIALVGLTCAIAGCGFRYSYTSAGNSSISFSKDQPGELSKEELEKKLVEVNLWKKASLQDSGNGAFKGSAVDSDGKELAISEVSQTETHIKCVWTLVQQGAKISFP